MKHLYLLILLINIYPFGLIISQTWEVPADKKSRVAPFKFDEETVRKGEKLYIKDCKSCHGMPGTGTNIKMTPVPYDPVSKEYQSNTDGEIYYKITEGRGAMPSFKNIINETDRWLIVSYVRSFNKEYTQAEPLEDEFAELRGKFNLIVNHNTDKKTINVQLESLVNASLKEKTTLQGYEINLFANRIFGKLKISESKLTDAIGKTSFNYPTDLPGDKDGYVNISVIAGNESSGITISKDTILKIGLKADQSKLLDTRSWWNVRSKAPIWLISVYTISLLTVIGVILYILNLLYLIWKAGKTVN